MFKPMHKVSLFFVLALLFLGCQDDNPASLLLADSLYKVSTHQLPQVGTQNFASNLMPIR